MKKIILAIGVIFLCISCAEESKARENINPLKYRKEIAALNLDYTPELFLEHVRKNDVLVVELFLKAGMNPNSELNIKNGRFIFNPLLITIQYDYADMAKLLLKHGADPLKEIKRDKLLDAAISIIRTDIVKHMLASISSKQKKYLTPRIKTLAIAARKFVGINMTRIKPNGSKLDYDNMIKVIEGELGVSLENDIKEFSLALEKQAKERKEREQRLFEERKKHEQERQEHIAKQQAEEERKRQEKIKKEQEAKAAKEKYKQELLKNATKGLVINDDGTVTDTINGLMWMRCALSQKWNGSTCEDLGKEEAKKFRLINNRKKVNKIVSSIKFAGYDDWRLPFADELNTLVYCSTGKRGELKKKNGEIYGGFCKKRNQYQKPTIVISYFPNTPVKKFTSRDRAKPKMFKRVSFNDGSITKRDNMAGAPGLKARLVRTIK